MKAKQQPAQKLYSPEREKRVAAALRENLRKRKQQIKPAIIRTDKNEDAP